MVLNVALCLSAGSSPAAELIRKPVAITSYPKDLTDPFKKAFEAKYPGTEVQVSQKKYQQRVVLARSIVIESRVLLLDDLYQIWMRNTAFKCATNYWRCSVNSRLRPFL